MLDIINYEESMPIKVELLEIKELPWHTHKDIQIIYVLEGELQLKLTYTSYPLKKNDIHFIHSDDVHGLTGITEDNLIIVLSININYFSKFFTNLSTQIFSTRVNEDAHLYVKQQMELKYYIFSIISLLNKRDLDYIDQVCALSKSLIGALYKDFRGFAINKTNRNFEPKFSHDFIQTERISRVVSFIYENYAYKLSLSEIAENEHINKYYLSHLFQKFVCENFRDFVSMVRVEMSESKLLETDKSVSFIAGECGFSNAKYYIDHFITWFGVHPNAYREKCRPNTIDFKSSSFTVHELKEIEPLLKDYLDSIVEFSDSFSISPSTKASIDFSSHSTAEFHLFEHFTLHIYDPDLHPCLNFEENALHLMNTLHHVGGHTKISILEPLATKMLSSETDPASIYLDTFVHSKCIEIMKEFVLNPTGYQIESMVFMDSIKNTSALLTVNGLKKPSFYLLDFLMKLGNQLIDCGVGHIITKNENAFQGILFNASYEKTLDFTLDISNIDENYQLTQETLLASSSCIDYWCQLNFNSIISPKDFLHIENMSMPNVGFEIIPKSDHYIYSIPLEPQDIVFISIEPAN